MLMWGIGWKAVVRGILRRTLPYMFMDGGGGGGGTFGGGGIGDDDPDGDGQARRLRGKGVLWEYVPDDDDTGDNEDIAATDPKDKAYRKSFLERHRLNLVNVKPGVINEQGWPLSRM